MRRALSLTVAIMASGCSYSNYTSTGHSAQKSSSATWNDVQVVRAEIETDTKTSGFNAPRGGLTRQLVYAMRLADGSEFEIDVTAQHLPLPSCQTESDRARGDPFMHLSQVRSPTDCVRDSLLWGQFLTSNPFDESAYMPLAQQQKVGRALLTRAFRDGKKGLEQAGVNAAETAIRQLSTAAGPTFFPDDMSNDAAVYFLAAWRVLPVRPESFEPFLAKVKAAEWLKKAFIAMRTGAEVSKEVARAAPAFYEEALAFHLLPFPESEAVEKGCIDVALSTSGMVTSGCGYTTLSGRSGLQPLAALAQTDATEGLLILDLLAKNGLLTADAVQTAAAKLISAGLRAQVADTPQWIERSRAAGDHRLTAMLLIRESEPYELLRDPATASKKLGDAAELLEKIDDRPLLAGVLLKRAKLQRDMAQWDEAYRTITKTLSVLEALYGFADAESVEEAIGLDLEILRSSGHEQEVAAHEARHDELRKRVAQSKQLAEITAAISATGDAADVRDHAQKLAEQSNPDDYLGVALRLEFVDVLIQTGELERASQLIESIRPGVRRLIGKPGEIRLLAMKIDAEGRRGNMSAFLKAIDEYEVLGRADSGDHWRRGIELQLARRLVELEEFARAEEALDAYAADEELEELLEPALKQDNQDHTPDILRARILLARGETDEATRIVHALSEYARSVINSTAPVQNVKQRDAARALLDDLAVTETGLGHSEHALALLEPLLPETDPAEDIDLWVQQAVRVGELQLATGAVQKELVARFEHMAPLLPEFPELNPLNAARMDIFLGRYYAKTGNTEVAMQRLRRALDVAKASGGIDEQIVIHLEMGLIAEGAGNLTTAIEDYSRSTALLRSVSQRIDSHAAKIGYRSQRARAIPLLVNAIYDAYAVDRDRRRIPQLLAAVEEGKSRALTELLSGRGDESTTTFEIAALQRSLPERSALIEYAASGERVFRFDVRRTEVNVELLAVTTSQIDTEVQAIRDSIVSGEPDDILRERLQTLARNLLPARFLAGTSDEKLLYLVPTGALYLIPFGLLIDGAGKYIDDRDVELVYLPNASFLTRPRPGLASSAHTVAVVNPSLDAEHHEYLATETDIRTNFEAAVSRWIPATLHWEERQTPEQFLEAIDDATVVFVYSHARFLPDDPMSSYIRFASGAGGGELSAAELIASRAVGSLWVIAACSTGTGRIRTGDEVLGLPRALLARGVGMVVVSLWDVDVASSFRMMTVFFRELGQKQSVAAALHRARRDIRSSGGSLFDWAPFVQVGFDDFRR